MESDKTSRFSVCERKKLFYRELWQNVLRKQSYKTKIINHSVALFEKSDRSLYCQKYKKEINLFSQDNKGFIVLAAATRGNY